MQQHDYTKSQVGPHTKTWLSTFDFDQVWCDITDDKRMSKWYWRLPGLPEDEPQRCER